MPVQQSQSANLVSNGYVLRAVPAVSEVAEVVIDTRGGDIRVGGHTLFVPNGAVAEPTRFRMEVVAGPFVQVSLSAERVADGEAVRTFPNELRLRIKLESKREDRLQAEAGSTLRIVDDSNDGKVY